MWKNRRAVGRSKNTEGGHNVSPLVDIGLNNLPKTRGRGAPDNVMYLNVSKSQKQKTNEMGKKKEKKN